MTASLKKILVSNGTTGQTGTTRATTREGYLKAAKRIWPYSCMTGGTVRVYDLKTNKIIFEEYITRTTKRKTA